MSTVFGAGPEFCEQSRIYNGRMMEQHFETPYDSIMKTVKVDSHLACILTFKHIFMAQKLETRCEKNTFILFKIQSKKPLFYQK